MRTFIATLAAAVVHAQRRQAPQPIQIIIDGVETTKYVASWSCAGKANMLNCPPEGRAFLVNDPWFDTDEPNLWTPNLLGASIEYDVDLKNLDCGCLSKVSLLGMPTVDKTGRFDHSDEYFYCDAGLDKKGGALCPEINLMKANKYALETIMKPCTRNTGVTQYANWSECEWGGLMRTSTWLSKEKGFGPGDEFTINTNKPVHIKVDLEEELDQF